MTAFRSRYWIAGEWLKALTTIVTLSVLQKSHRTVNLKERSGGIELSLCRSLVGLQGSCGVHFLFRFLINLCFYF